MSSYYFIKLYHEILDDPQMGKLPDNLWRRYFEFALIANKQPEQDGRLPSLSDLAWTLRTTETRIFYDLAELRGFNLADNDEAGWFIINFAGRFRTEVSHYNTPEWRETRAVILERDAHTCRYCGEPATHVDHIAPRIQGGSDDHDNLVAACESCNKGKGGRTPEQAGMELLQ
jgi:hypothetical protein